VTTSKTKIHHPYSIWPNQEEMNPHEGFDDDYLEFLVGRNVDDSLSVGSKKSPILYWTSELYGAGKCYREWLNWPYLLPLPFYDDHGPAASLKFAEHEINNSSKFHLTPLLERAQENRHLKNIIQAPYPWIPYKKKVGYRKEKDAKGTIVFYPHSNDGIELLDYDWDAYFESLKKLPQDFHPFVLCLHRHDIKKGYHKKLRRYGLPIVTIGESLSPFFVDRFYSMISKFRFATSNTGGSEVFLCEEHGVNFFIYGDRPVYFNYSHDQVPLGKRSEPDPYLEKLEYLKRKYFYSLPGEFVDPKRQLVTSILGTDLDSHLLRSRLKRMMIIESIRLFPNIIFVVVRYILSNMLPKYLKDRLINIYYKSRKK